MELPAEIDELVIAVNHELRTPLTVISGYAQLMLEDGGLTPVQRDRLERIVANSDRLERAVEAVVARISDGI